MTPKLDEARLRELAEAATPGPWDEVHSIAGPMMVKGGGKDRRNVCLLSMGRDGHANAAFIAAANPATILALLDALSAERERGDRAVGLLRRWMADLPSEALEDVTASFLSEGSARHG